MALEFSRVPDQNGISRLYNMLVIYHSGPEPSFCWFPSLSVVQAACFLWMDLLRLSSRAAVVRYNSQIKLAITSPNYTSCTSNLLYKTLPSTEIEVADQAFHLTQSQYTDTGPTSPSADPITPDAWQGSHWSANFEVTGMARPRKNLGPSGIRIRGLPLSRRTP